jgi:hypothetical protein
MSKIIGYINANNFLPSFVSMVCQDGDELFLVCPCSNPDERELRNVIGLTIPYLQTSKKYTPEKKEKYYERGEIAYMFSSEVIFVGNENELEEILRGEITKHELPNKDKERIIDFMKKAQMQLS